MNQTMSHSQSAEASFARPFFGPFYSASHPVNIFGDTILMVSIFLVSLLIAGMLSPISVSVAALIVIASVPLLLVPLRCSQKNFPFSYH